MTKETKRVGHEIPSDIRTVDYMVPKNLDEGNIMIVSTIWDTFTKKGERKIWRLPKRNYWRIEKCEVECKAYSDKTKAFADHEKIVKEMRKNG